MPYVFDTSPLSTLFKNYYRRRFPSLWDRFDALVADGTIISTREVLREIEVGPVEALRLWGAAHQSLFPTPTAAEASFVGQIYSVAHFRQNIEAQKILKGGRIADPFVVARASVEGARVVTMEVLKPHAAKIPNICDHFDIECLSLEQFMEEEGWVF